MLQRFALLALLSAAGVSYFRKHLSELPRASSFNPITGKYESRPDSLATTIEFVERSVDNNGARVVFIEKCLANSPERFYPDLPCSVPKHVHLAQVETFEVLEGVMSFELNGTLGQARTGDSAVIPEGLSHTFWNNHTEDLVVKVTLEPALENEAFFETLWGLSKQGYVSPLQMLTTLLEFDMSLGDDVPQPVQLAIKHLLIPFAKLLGYERTYAEYLSPETLKGMQQ